MSFQKTFSEDNLKNQDEQEMETTLKRKMISNVKIMWPKITQLLRRRKNVSSIGRFPILYNYNLLLVFHSYLYSNISTYKLSRH